MRHYVRATVVAGIGRAIFKIKYFRKILRDKFVSESRFEGSLKFLDPCFLYSRLEFDARDGRKRRVCVDALKACTRVSVLEKVR